MFLVLNGLGLYCRMDVAPIIMSTVFPRRVHTLSCDKQAGERASERARRQAGRPAGKQESERVSWPAGRQAGWAGRPAGSRSHQPRPTEPRHAMHRLRLAARCEGGEAGSTRPRSGGMRPSWFACLDVGHAVLGTYALDLGHGLAVREHGEAGEEVVLHLVVEIAVQICSRARSERSLSQRLPRFAQK